MSSSSQRKLPEHLFTLEYSLSEFSASTRFRNKHPEKVINHSGAYTQFSYRKLSVSQLGDAVAVICILSKLIHYILIIKVILLEKEACKSERTWRWKPHHWGCCLTNRTLGNLLVSFTS